MPTFGELVLILILTKKNCSTSLSKTGQTTWPLVCLVVVDGTMEKEDWHRQKNLIAEPVAMGPHFKGKVKRRRSVWQTIIREIGIRLLEPNLHVPVRKQKNSSAIRQVSKSLMRISKDSKLSGLSDTVKRGMQR